MIALLALAAASMPPATDGPLEWCVTTVIDRAPQTSVCPDGATATTIRAEMARQASLIMTPEQMQAWTIATSLTTPKSQRYGEWMLEARPGTYVRVTLHNKARDIQ